MCVDGWVIFDVSSGGSKKLKKLEGPEIAG